MVGERLLVKNPLAGSHARGSRRLFSRPTPILSGPCLDSPAVEGP